MVAVYKLFAQMPQGDLSFEVRYRRVDEQAKTINKMGYDAKKSFKPAVVNFDKRLF